jgi:hypothetical protein
MDNGISAVDAMAMRNMDGNEGYNSWFWIIILFLFMFGNNGWGNNNGALTRAELNEGFNFNQLDNAIRSLERGQCSLGYESLNQSRETQAAIANLGYQQQNCCCETNRNIDAVRAENYKNTCEITTAIHAEGEATRALINQNVMQELRDQLQAAQLQLGTLSQTSTIINAVRPFPQPAYITCSPYTAYNGYGCGNNNCCG